MATGKKIRRLRADDEGMVERTVTRTVERTGDAPDDGVENGLEEVSLQEMETYENVERIRAELGDDEGYVLLARRMPNGTLATLAKINANIFDVDYIIKKYGGGTYSARFFKAGVQINKGGFLGSVPFIIDPSVQPEPEAAPVRNAVTGDGAPSWLAATLDKMSDAIKLMAERRPDPPPPAVDPITMITKLAEAAKAMMPPLPPAAAAAPDLEKQLSLIEKVVNVGTKIIDARGEGSEPSSGDVYMGAVSKLAEPIVELVKAKTQQEMLRAGAGVRRPALPPAQPTGPVPSQEGGDKVVAANWLMEIQRWMPLIVGRHRKQLSAEDTAFFVMDELSPTTLAALAEFLSRPDSDAMMRQVVPTEVVNDAVWYGEFMQAVSDYLEGGEDEAAAEEEAEGSSESPILPPIDLEAESKARLAKLRDKPQGQ